MVGPAGSESGRRGQWGAGDERAKYGLGEKGVEADKAAHTKKQAGKVVGGGGEKAGRGACGEAGGKDGLVDPARVDADGDQKNKGRWAEDIDEKVQREEARGVEEKSDSREGRTCEGDEGKNRAAAAGDRTDLPRRRIHGAR